jgi:OHCU decarboxylase
MLPIEALNASSRSDFIESLKPLFEAADPLADALYAQRPFASYEDLFDKAHRSAAHLRRAEQIQVVNAHPRIGADPSSVSSASYSEQGYEREVGQDLRAVYEELNALNAQYEERFGFRFVVFVNGRSKPEILDVLRARIHNDADDELRTALQAMLDIARDRYRRAT